MQKEHTGVSAFLRAPYCSIPQVSGVDHSKQKMSQAYGHHGVRGICSDYQKHPMGKSDCQGKGQKGHYLWPLLSFQGLNMLKLQKMR